MRQLILVLCLIGCELTATAQSNAPVPSPAPAPISATAPSPAPAATDASAAPAKPTEPLSTTEADNTRYLNDPSLLDACTARVTAIDDKPCNIIFIGDSITQGWLEAGKDVWDKVYAPRHALDFGISGDKTQNVLWRLNNMSIQNLKPKVAVVMIGTNNTMNSPHEIADGIKAVLANTEEAFPGVKIILVSIMPNERAEDKMAQANALIKGYADDENVFFLNLIPLMTPIVTTQPDGKIDTNWKGLGKDHLHPDASGYQLWADAMEPLLKKLGL
jgi:lysophospholipase L1-like esterase